MLFYSFALGTQSCFFALKQRKKNEKMVASSVIVCVYLEGMDSTTIDFLFGEEDGGRGRGCGRWMWAWGRGGGGQSKAKQSETKQNKKR